MRQNFETNPETGKTIVKLAKVRRTELAEDERAELRIYYWAAYYGKQNFVIGYMILLLRWSPFIKAYMK